GQLIYRRIVSLPVVSVIGVVALYALIWAGPSVPIQMPAEVAGMSGNAVWILLLFLYAGIASVLPVWMLL
ncbi:MAG TPA: carbon starvation protein A, partial [Pseudomonas sp.]|nr:carbon starvation protein A [Pseudomonas sp.]